MNHLNSSQLRHWAARLVGPVFYVLLVVFLVFYLKSVDFSKLRHLQVSWHYIIIASLLGLITRYCGAFIWLVILRGLGAGRIRNLRQMFYVYAKAWLGRYIPGTAPWILGKIFFASKYGISKEKLGIASLLEGGLQILVMLVLSFVILAFDPRLDVISGYFKILMVLVVVVGILVIYPPIFNRLMSLGYRLVRKRPLDAEHYAGAGMIMRSTTLYMVAALINGVSMFFVAKGVYPRLGYGNLLFITGVASLASSAGMLALFAPSGIGVREGIQLVLYSLVMPREIALVVTVVLRLWSIAIDLLFFALTRLMVKP